MRIESKPELTLIKECCEAVILMAKTTNAAYTCMRKQRRGSYRTWNMNIRENKKRIRIAQTILIRTRIEIRKMNNVCV